MNTFDQAALAANCRPDSWVRLTARLAVLHIDASSGPQRLVQLLEQANGGARADAQRVLRAMQRMPWRVLALQGPFRGSARLGFQVLAGSRSWWLQFEPAPQLRIVRIEALGEPV